MFKAVIFDMDGVLIDSEPLWRKAETEIFRSIGIPFEEEMGLQTMGVRIDLTVLYWHKIYQWKKPSLKEVEHRINRRVEELIIEQGKAKEGVVQTLKFMHGKKMRVALASSAHMHIINTVVKTLKIDYYFELLRSAESEKHPKPAPDVYLTTAKLLNIDPSNCLVIEDSPVGIEAAKAAGMTCVAIPEKEVLSDPRIKIADFFISSLSEINDEFWNNLNK
jgi:mannitol-1-/sugar-/sorbitol-6-/2-deoxyglucose-6-phosphatase